MNVTKLIIVITFSLVIISCTGNDIYYDIQKKAIISCEGATLSTLSIEGKGNNTEFYYLTSHKGVEVFNFNDIPTDFIIKDKKDKTVVNSDFKLKSLSHYKISNISVGDAKEKSVIVATNEKSEIVSADKEKCND